MNNLNSPNGILRGTRRGFFKRLLLFLFGGLIARSPSAGAAPAAGGATSNAGAAAQVPGSAGVGFAPGEDPPIRREYDLVVVGGGISGVSAAISAARHGVKVALVHNRSMLGGNSSSEVKLFPENNPGQQVWIKEGGIHDEFHTEERVRNHRELREGTMNCHWDLVLYEWVMREENIDLYLNTHMHRAIMRSPTQIAAVFCFQIGTEKTFELHAPLFVDSSGDGYLAARAGADFRWGKEARAEYGEPEAPEQTSDEVMGNTLFFTALDVGRPVPFKLPEWAAKFPTEEDLSYRSHRYIEGGYWWIEVGTPLHPIKDNNEIVHEGLRQLLGIWDHIKNHCEHKEDATNYGLDFVGFWPYKRECRRILGDYVLTQQHVQNPPALPDSVAYGAWGIDIHLPGGIHNRTVRPYEGPAADEFWDRLGTVPYGIPLRALYSRNVENLMMAGRPISGSYVAFASTRVLSTGSIVGQAVGVAASLCKKYGKGPRAVAREHIQECQQIILRDDGHIPGVANEDPADLARQASVTASSEWAFELPEPNVAAVDLGRLRAQIFPVSADRIDRLDLLLSSRLNEPAQVRIGLRPANHVWDFRSEEDIATASAVVPAGAQPQWISFELQARLQPGRYYYVYVKEPVPGVLWSRVNEIAGMPWREYGEPNRLPPGITAADRPGEKWRRVTMGSAQQIRLHPETRPFSPQNVVLGTNRPDQWTNLWISDPAQALPAWLELRWPRAISFNTVHLTFDTDLNRRAALPHYRYPDCVKDYDIEGWIDGRWMKLSEGRDNYVRRRVHRFEPARTDRLRVRVLATNGAPAARIYEARVYDDAG